MNAVKLLWLEVETILIIIMIMTAYIWLWWYTPYNTLTKLAVNSLSLILLFDMFRTWIYTRWIAAKYDEENKEQ